MEIAARPGRPSIAVVMPMYNAAKLLRRSLAPLQAMLADREIDEIIVVDDCSTDDGPAMLAEIQGVTCLKTPQNMGPGGARNLAAISTQCEYLWFVDSDVIVAPNAARVLAGALSETDISAVFGSYDEMPDAQNFLSQYKNLVHHYYHQRAKADATTFWAGCGAVRRVDFLAVGAFDVARFPNPSVEDIELGYRLTDAKYRIRFEPAFQGKHLKEWRLVNLVHTEVFRRAIPWATMMFSRTQLTNDLNVGFGERIRAVIAGLAVLAMLGWAIGFWGALLPLGLVGVAIAFNFSFSHFFLKRRGSWFAVRAFLFHQLYYLYSGAAFVFAWAQYKLRRLA